MLGEPKYYDLGIRVRVRVRGNGWPQIQNARLRWVRIKPSADLSEICLDLVISL